LSQLNNQAGLGQAGPGRARRGEARKFYDPGKARLGGAWQGLARIIFRKEQNDFFN